MRKTFLPDINFWLALVFDTHAHHEIAKAWMDGLRDEVCLFCRMSQQGFLRLANNPQVFRDDAVTMKGAWELLDTAMRDGRIGYAVEPPALEAAWRALTGTAEFAPKKWNDAYLAAFAQAGSYELVTFDRGLAQYADVAVRVLG